jgi:hypothetical protein
VKMAIFFNNLNWIEILVGLFIWGLFATVFFHFTHGSGKYIFVSFSFFYIFLFIINPLISFFTALVAGVLLILQQRLQSKSKKKYQKAVAKFEGGGIRRGLTPPEIGAVLGIPFHRILTLVIVGLLDKRFVIIGDEHYLQIRVSDSMQTRSHSLNTEVRAALRRNSAQKLRQVLFPFEEPFLELLEQEDGKIVAEIDFSFTVKPFFQSVSDRVSGYDLNETRDYYIKMVLKYSEDGNSAGFSGIHDYREMEWKLLRLCLDDEYEVGLYELPGWFIAAEESSEKNLSNKDFTDWVIGLEEAIKSGLSQEDFKINLDKMVNENSSEILKEIIHVTYHI